MTSPDDLHNLEQQLRRALRAHGDSVEPSPDAYARIVRAVEAAPGRSRPIRGLLSPLRGADRLIAMSADSLRPLAFLAAVLAVAGLGGYSLFSLASSPADTATAAPATADVSDLVPQSDGSDADESSIEADRSDNAGATTSDSRMADSTDASPRSSVPSDSAATGTASAAASDPVERYDGLTYAPVRISALEAAQAFLDLLGIDDVQLEERNDQVIVRPNGTAAPADAGSILTTLEIGSIGDGFMVVEARSDRLGLSIADISTIDRTADDIVDDAVVTAPIELSGTTSDPATEVTIALRSVIDGSALARTSTSADPAAGNGTGYRSTLAVTGAERVWAVATATSPVDGVRSLAARSVFYSGRPDPASYTVVGLPPDDPDGGLILRSAPDGQPIGIIELGSTGVRRRPVPPRIVDDVVWWAVADAAGREGWAASRYLAVDEAPGETTMVELARKVIAAVIEGEPSAVDDIGLSKPVFVGSIVDPHPMFGLADVEALLTTRRRLATGGAGGPGAVAEFYGFDRWADVEVFVPKGYREEGAAERARAYFGDLPSVVIRSLNPETGGWERVHLFVSRNGDRPTLVGMVLEHEPLPNVAAAHGEPGTPPPVDSDG